MEIKNVTVCSIENVNQQDLRDLQRVFDIAIGALRNRQNSAEDEFLERVEEFKQDIDDLVDLQIL